MSSVPPGHLKFSLSSNIKGPIPKTLHKTVLMTIYCHCKFNSIPLPEVIEAPCHQNKIYGGGEEHLIRGGDANADDVNANADADDANADDVTTR